MKLNIEDYKSVIVEQHDGSTYLIEIKDDVLSFKPIDIVNNSELKECKKIKKYFETILNNKNDVSKDEEKAYKKWIEDTFKCSKRKEKKFSKDEMKHFDRIPFISTLSTPFIYKSDSNEHLNEEQVDINNSYRDKTENADNITMVDGDKLNKLFYKIQEHIDDVKVENECYNNIIKSKENLKNEQE